MKNKTNFYYCQSKVESREKCIEQCDHCQEYYKPLENERLIEDLKAALVSIYDTLTLADNDPQFTHESQETLSEMFFRKLNAYNIDLKEFTGLDYLEPVKYAKQSASIEQMGTDVFGSIEKFYIWANKKNQHLGKKPIQLSEKELLNYLIRLDYGDFGGF